MDPTTDMATPESFSPIRWEGEHLELLDQTLLPRSEEWLVCRTPEDVAEAIRRLSVRGAPAIGVAAGFGLVVGLESAASGQPLEERFDEVSDLLGGTRPTAVNLRWALERGREVFEASAGKPPSERIAALRAWADELHRRDVSTNRTIGDHGAEVFAEGDRVLTHCNAGALATGGYGTAVGVIESSWRRGRASLVWVDETRPLLQGSRLTSWELQRLGIPFRLVTDSSVGALMSRGLVDRVVVGADRIAANGDVANKIGTYTVAVMAERHGVPFYVRRASLHDRPTDRLRRRHPDRGARGRRGDGRLRHSPGSGRDRGRELRLRRHAQRAGRWHHHRDGRVEGSVRGVHSRGVRARRGVRRRSSLAVLPSGAVLLSVVGGLALVEAVGIEPTSEKRFRRHLRA